MARINDLVTELNAELDQMGGDDRNRNLQDYIAIQLKRIADAAEGKQAEAKPKVKRARVVKGVNP